MAVPIAAAAGKAAKIIAKQMAKKAASKATSGGGGDNELEGDGNRDATIAVTVVAITVIVGLIIAIVQGALQGFGAILPNPTIASDQCYILPETEDGLLVDNESDYVNAHGPNNIPAPGSGGTSGGGGSGGGSRSGGIFTFLPGESVPEHTGPLVFPMEKKPGFRKTSGMVARNGYPHTAGGYYHGGFDWADGTNGSTKVFAVADGVVFLTRVTPQSGNEVYTQHRINGKNYVTRNVHLYNPPEQFVSEGQIITAGQQIGLVGNTGSNSTGPHLHFEVWEERLNNWVSPDIFLALGGAPIVAGPALPGSPLDDGFVTIPAAGGVAGSGAVEVCYTQGGEHTTSPYGGTSVGDLYPNGRIPAAALCSLSFAPGHSLDCNAARAFENLNREFRAEFGYNIAVTDSYRSYEAQVRCREEKGSMCAEPGTSNHGFGRAVDLASNINSFGTPTHNWMRQHAPRFGWVLPAWAQQNGAKPEPWHWEYNGGGDGKSPQGAKQIALTLMQQRPTWDTNQEFQCLDNLWERESNWNYKAENPSSGAYGIPQSLPGNKMASHGTDWRTNPTTQISWGLDYIAGRYGTPCAAWQHSERHNWY